MATMPRTYDPSVGSGDDTMGGLSTFLKDIEDGYKSQIEREKQKLEAQYKKDYEIKVQSMLATHNQHNL